MQNINSATRYKISPLAYNNKYIAYDQSNNLTLVDAASKKSSVSDPLEFAITPSLTDSGYWNLCMSSPNGKYCMDQWGDNASQPAFQIQGDVTGQQWNLTRRLQGQSTAWQMQTIFAGSRYLTAYAGGAGLEMISGANEADTLFMFLDVASSTSTSTSVPASTTSTSTSSQTSASSSTTASSSQIPEQAKTGLPAGAIAGIVVGIILLLAIIGAFLFSRRKKRSPAPPDSSTVTSEKTDLSGKQSGTHLAVQELPGQTRPVQELSHDQAAVYEMGTHR